MKGCFAKGSYKVSVLTQTHSYEFVGIMPKHRGHNSRSFCAVISMKSFGVVLADVTSRYVPQKSARKSIYILKKDFDVKKQ